MNILNYFLTVAITVVLFHLVVVVFEAKNAIGVYCCFEERE
jgi:hypothetical protein